MDFSNFTFDLATVAGDTQCTNITILDDDIFEKFQVIDLIVGKSDPVGIEMDESLSIKIIDDGKLMSSIIMHTNITVLIL